MKIIKYSLALVALVFMVHSCTKIDPDMNINPNNPTDISTASLLLQAERGLASEIWDEWNNGRFGLLYAQYWAQRNYTSESRYQYRPGVVDNLWSALYSGGLMDLEQIKSLNIADGSLSPSEANDNAIVTILQAYYFHMMTDIWGSIPYSDALRGAESTRPKYDKQEEVYAGLIQNISDAIGLLQTSAGDGTSFGSYDILYGGDLGAWVKFGNALLMRICIRAADRAGDLNSMGVNVQSVYETASQNTFTSNTDNAKFSFLSSQPNTNPLFVDRIERKNADFAVSKTLLDLMNGLGPNGDPRRAYYADSAEAGGYLGVPYGMTSSNAATIKDSFISYPSGAKAVIDANVNFGTNNVLAPDAPAMLLDYAEICFMNAEAAERGWAVSMSAKDYYNAGITASMEYWGGGAIDASMIADYIADPTVDYDQLTGSWKEKIGVQKWLALYMQGVQGWSEWRRLDFGVLQLPVDGILLDNGIPNRWPYPSNETTNNGQNYTKAVSEQGIDNQNTKVWWDVN